MDRSLPMRGTKKPPPSPTHHLRILPIRPRSARRYPAFLVDRIDVPDNFAIAPLQSHTAEIRRSELRLDQGASVGSPSGQMAPCERPLPSSLGNTLASVSFWGTSEAISGRSEAIDRKSTRLNSSHL